MSENSEGKLTAPLVEPRRIAIRTLRAAVEAVDGAAPEGAEGEVITVGTAPGNALVLEDRTVSGYHLELRAVSKGIEVQDLGSTNGTFYSEARVQKIIVPSGSILRLGRTKLKVVQGLEGQAAVSQFDGKYGLVGNSDEMQRLFARVEKVAPADVGALLHGESGTGKELVARALHDLGVGEEKPFVTVDCGAISPNLIASELFGHERGSFTGATNQHRGAFERADGGVLFLDEVGELPSALQPQLLGVLERGRFRRVGGTTEISVNVRVVSATHRDLRREVNQGTFRLDLYYRIAQVVLELPSLRDRREDIAFLVEHFLRQCGHDGPVDQIVPLKNLQALTTYRWPGNVRELRNWVEATVALGEMGDLPEGGGGDAPSPNASLSESAETGASQQSYKEARAHVLDTFEKEYLSDLLKRTGGNVSAAAREARMDRTYLIKLLTRHQLR